MSAYKYHLENGKLKWYASFYYTDWQGEKKRKVKRGFDTRKDALEFERSFIDKGAKDPTILFSDLAENYLAECEPRLKPTTLANKRFILDSKVIPYFGKMKICDIDPITVHLWQNMLLDYRDENGDGYSPTYLNTMHGKFSAVMNYAVRYYGLKSNPCQTADRLGHESPETTWRVYSHLYPGRDRELADELDKVRVQKNSTENTNSES